MPLAKNFGIFRVSAKFTQETNNKYHMIHERKFTNEIERFPFYLFR